MMRTAILLVPGVYLSAVYGLCELFEFAEKTAPGSFTVETVRPGAFRDSADMRPPYGLVVIPPFRTDVLTPKRPRAPFSSLQQDCILLDEKFKRTAAALGREYERGAKICSVCAGAFYLCAAGIADGKKATTHWNLAGSLAALFPLVEVEAERMLIDSGSFATAGGLTAWQDLGLHLIRDVCGEETALAAASTFLINPGDRSQLAYAMKSLERFPADETVAKAIAVMTAECASGIGISETADRCGVTVRTLLRRFALSGAESPGAMLRSIRLEKARKLLATGTASVKEVARECGYADAASFARAFRAEAGTTPADYRRAFASSKSSKNRCSHL
ncbi:helix-turn-helix domain-containing protein [Treponema zuelzerae]|uniref:Helix-turn-helix domain-containing protein n=1 Tax=Teretinema zuelzerae TaxID=156 RepID=A0AAE3JIE9_9SPIR|nr:helix-turn-helix domain-containing protein [Teretinema zuelzerae]MCD1654086.1 helix-turn-helix domain-containing protein [Teretinema zuelzerae]